MPEALEAFDRADDVDQRIDRAHFVQRDLSLPARRGSALGLAQQPEGPHRSLAYPG